MPPRGRFSLSGPSVPGAETGFAGDSQLAGHIPGMTNYSSTPMMRSFAAAVRANVPTCLWGNPGVGKSAVVESFGRANGFHVETVSGANREASDYLGLPVEVDGEVHYSSLAWAKRLADAPKGLFFGDEASTNSLSVQKAMLRILQERVVGELQLPDTVAMVLAANPPSVAVDGLELPAAVANRIFHLDWFFDSQAWLDGIVTDFAHVAPPQIDIMLGAGSDVDVARVRGAVTAFLRTRPQLLTSTPPTNPVQAGKGWCSPRSWHNAMKILAELNRDDEDAELLVLRGCVGDGAATEYLAWKVAMDLHDPEAVLADPSIVRWGAERPDRLFALIASITALTLSRGDKTTWDKGVAVLVACARGGFGGERTGPGKPDVATPGARILFNNMPKGAKVSTAARDAFATILAHTGRWEVVA